MGSWKSFRESEPVVLFICSVWLVVCFQYFLPMVLLLPLSLIPGVGTNLYRRVVGVYDKYARQACMCVPFSWCGMTVHTNDVAGFMNFKSQGSSLCLANHGSRIDWVGAIFVGMCGGGAAAARVGFVAEVTTGLMPIVGWSRVLFGDILLQRAFHKDGPRILKNIRSFTAAGVHRMIMLAPEGTIADPGVAADERYIVECGKFMTSMGKAPMEYLLTPRYKGMSVFVTHAPTNVASVTMAFVRPNDAKGGEARIDPKTQRVVGGENCARKLSDPERYIPDLHTIFKGGLSLYFNFNMLPLYCPPPGENCDDAGAKKIRDQLIADQQRKDGDLKCFDEHRTFPGLKASEHLPLGAPGKQQWGRLGGGAEEVGMNLVLALHTSCTVAAWAWLTGLPYGQVVVRIGWLIAAFFAVHATSHKLGQWTSDGRSRESLVGETAIKALLALVTGRDMNRGGSADAAAAAKKTE